jgi:hypothetical protein
MTEPCPPDSGLADHQLTPLQAQTLLALVMDLEPTDDLLPRASHPDAPASPMGGTDAATKPGAGGNSRKLLYFCTLALTLAAFSRVHSI